MNRTWAGVGIFTCQASWHHSPCAWLYFSSKNPTPVLVGKASDLRRRTKNWGIHAKQDEVEVDLKELITKNFSRRIRLLISEPIILAITIYMSFIYGLLYCFLTAYPLVFQDVHGIKPGVAGLPFFGMVVGILIVAGYFVWDSKNYNKKLAANGGVPVPEWRLPPIILGGVLFAIGLFWFGWSGYKQSVHWIVPTLSGLSTGLGLLAIFICCFNYIIDSYLMLLVTLSAWILLRSLVLTMNPALPLPSQPTPSSALVSPRAFPFSLVRCSTTLASSGRPRSLAVLHSSVSQFRCYSITSARSCVRYRSSLPLWRTRSPWMKRVVVATRKR